MPLWFSPSLSWRYEVRLNGERVVSGFEIERWGLENSAGDCVGYRCVGGRQNWAGRGNWKRQYIYIYIYIYISLFWSRETRCLFCLCYKLDFLYKNLFLTYLLSKIFIKYYINLIKPIQLKKERASLPVFVLYLCVLIWTTTLLSSFFSY